jgi:hypothetical protein
VLELIVQQTNSTVATTVLQSAGGLSSIDYSQLIILLASLVLGSSGIVGWILTYVQLRRETRERALQHFRELVLTPDFLGYLGALRNVAMAAAKANLRAKAQERIMNDASLSQEERFKRLKKMDEQYPTLTELTNLMEQARKAWVKRDEKITSTGVLSLMPDKIERQIKECLESIVAAQNPEAYASVVIQVDSVFTEIKKILGLTVFE